MNHHHPLHGMAQMTSGPPTPFQLEQLNSALARKVAVKILMKEEEDRKSNLNQRTPTCSTSSASLESTSLLPTKTTTSKNDFQSGESISQFMDPIPVAHNHELRSNDHRLTSPTRSHSVIGQTSVNQEGGSTTGALLQLGSETNSSKSRRNTENRELLSPNLTNNRMNGTNSNGNFGLPASSPQSGCLYPWLLSYSHWYPSVLLNISLSCMATIAKLSWEVLVSQKTIISHWAKGSEHGNSLLFRTF